MDTMNNKEVNTNENVDTSEQTFTDYQKNEKVEMPLEYQNNEVAFYPPIENNTKSKINKNRILKICLAIACAIAISFGTLLVSGELNKNGFDVPFIKSYNDDNENTKSTTNQNSDINKDIARKDVPTLTQLAARENSIPIPQIVTKVTPSVVGISSETPLGSATGTGIIMSQDGYIITNAHVVEDATSINVVIKNGDKMEECTAQLIGEDNQTDLAVIKVDKTGLATAEFGKSSDLMVGELAIAIGNPLGMDLAGSVTGGIISALNRDLTIEDRQLTLIQTDAAINPGNSGGPLVNSYGQVIGINSAKISSNYAEGLGFAIPIDDAKPIIDSLLSYGYVKGRPMIGISGSDISAVEARYYNMPQGVYIRAIEANTGAAKAGLKIGDIIVSVNGKKITSMDELNAIKKDHKAGDTVTLGIYRDDDIKDYTVELSESKQ